MGCVYQAQNKVNGMRYIGKTSTSLRQRKREHLRSNTTTYFHNALRKHGNLVFEWSILFVSDNEGLLAFFEQYFIDHLRTRRPKGYNLTDGGEGSPGQIASPEARAKISARHKGRKFSEEHKAKISAALKGRVITPEWREKLRIAQTGKKASVKARANMSAAGRGKKRRPLSPETRFKISQTKRIRHG